MVRIIDAQGRQTQRIEPGKLTAEIGAPASGTVVAVDNLQLARIARLAGAPMDKSAGVDLLKRLGDEVSRGEPLYRIHAEFAADFAFARKAAEGSSGYSIGASGEVPRGFAEF